MTSASDVGDEVEEIDETSSLLKPTTDESTPKWKPPRGFIWIEMGTWLKLKKQYLANLDS
jgi:hypothetical protein